METSFKFTTVYLSLCLYIYMCVQVHTVSGGRIGICRRIGKEEWVQRVLFLIIPNGI
jgi:hypothetical protein